MCKIAVIGAGSMGSSIVKGLIQSGAYQATNIQVSDYSEEAFKHIREIDSSILCTKNNSEVVREADIILIAVKPWIVETICSEIRNTVTEKQLIISIAAGVTLDQLGSFLSEGRESIPTLFRAIPNTAIAIRQSMTVVATNYAEEEATQKVLSLFNALGKAQMIEERLMGAATSLCSCGTAFALRYLRAATEGGVEMGLTAAHAQALIAQTVLGAMELIMTNNTHPEAEIDKVTTPGGITIKGLNAMEAAGFTHAVIEGHKAANPK